jgi:hypothetical protein
MLKNNKIKKIYCKKNNIYPAQQNYKNFLKNKYFKIFKLTF